MPNTTSQFAQRISRLGSSPIREILHVLERPGMISFAGGLPAVECFPTLDLERIPPSALQYGPSEGDTPLRERIAADMNERELAVEPDQVFILNGSQQGIDLVAKLFIEPDVCVAVEAPTYLAALQVFRLFGAKFFSFSPQDLASLRGHKNPPRMLYVNPTFQNPTGYCYTAKQRLALARLCEDEGIVVFEDDPYRDLAYETCARRPVVSHLERGNWVYQSSFSKTFAPGLRLGYLVCAKPLIKYFARLKQAADLHSNRLSQHLVYEHFYGRDPGARLNRITDEYRRKRELFDAYLHKHLGDCATWSLPKGGLFFWLHLHASEPMDTRLLLDMALEKSVAFMPGEAFFADSTVARNQIRLNFSLADSQQMDQGLKVLRVCLDAFGRKVRCSA
ncbi:MAG: aminotransferase-like domain-containing protein [Gammaproteobacteria bacterium]